MLEVMNLSHKALFILTFILFLLCSSCATIIFGTHQKVEIYSIPDSCTVYLDGTNTNKITPCELKVKRRNKSTFYNEKNEHSYILKRDGYYDNEIKDKATFNPWIIGNATLWAAGLGTNNLLLNPESAIDDERRVALMVGFTVAGGAIDAASGAYNKYQSRIFTELQPKPGFKNNTEIVKPSNLSSSGIALALIIGNGNYNNSPLDNPTNDADDMAYVLKSLGYDVMHFKNLDQASMRKSIDEFGNRLSDYDVGLFFFAGHGLQSEGINYLIPVDAAISSENDVEYTCVNAGRVLGKMESAGTTTNIIILDACRNNPFERSWTRSSQGGGLAVMDAPVGSLIGFATSPGSTASDGAGRNGLYTSAILENIHEPGITILELFQKVRKTVRETSEGQQVPWESTSLEGNYYFRTE